MESSVSRFYGTRPRPSYSHLTASGSEKANVRISDLYLAAPSSLQDFLQHPGRKFFNLAQRKINRCV